MPKFYFALIAFLIILSSCSRKFYYLDGFQVKTDKENPIDSIVVKSSFAGDALDYIVFELDIGNKTRDTLFISNTDANLILLENSLHDKPVIFHALDKEDILYDLEHTKESINKEKRTNTTLNIISVGLDLIGIAATRNVSAAETIIYTAESAGYILEERRAFNLLEGSLEEQSAYIEEWVLGKDFIAPGESRSWDILFERILVDSDASLEILLRNNEFYFDYRLEIREESY